jgi:hypothetical protein
MTHQPTESNLAYVKSKPTHQFSNAVSPLHSLSEPNLDLSDALIRLHKLHNDLLLTLLPNHLLARARFHKGPFPVRRLGSGHGEDPGLDDVLERLEESGKRAGGSGDEKGEVVGDVEGGVVLSDCRKEVWQ